MCKYQSLEWKPSANIEETFLGKQRNGVPPAEQKMSDAEVCLYFASVMSLIRVQIEKLVAAEAVAMALFEKELKWGPVAAHLKWEEGGEDWDADVLKNTYLAIPQSGTWILRTSLPYVLGQY
jgi:hypothetical protein